MLNIELPGATEVRFESIYQSIQSAANMKSKFLLLAIIAIAQQPKLSQANALSGIDTPEQH